VQAGIEGPAAVEAAVEAREKVMKRTLWLIPLLFVASAFADPIRSIRSTAFSLPAPCGPAWDASAARGQWFEDPATHRPDVRAWELHDDWPGSLVIQGQVQQILWDGTPASNIVGFTVLATVQNVIPHMPGGVSSNSHSELQSAPTAKYDGTLYQARIAAEFAVADALQIPGFAGWSPPYYPDPSGTYLIEAMNEHTAAWYCWSPGLPDPGHQPAGGFLVPAWDLGDIPPGGQTNVLMQFRIAQPGGLAAAMPWLDVRHSVIRFSLLNGGDVLYNRSDSLKISHWIDHLLVDYGSWIGGADGSGPEYIHASNASVFFDSHAAGAAPALTFQMIATNRIPDAIELRWNALDAVSYFVEYSDDLMSNVWTAVPGSLPVPPIVPSPMTWTDNGTVLTNPPIQLSPRRFYRVGSP
jgi:hypothetical protein